MPNPVNIKIVYFQLVIIIQKNEEEYDCGKLRPTVAKWGNQFCCSEFLEVLAFLFGHQDMPIRFLDSKSIPVVIFILKKSLVDPESSHPLFKRKHSVSRKV